MNSASRQTPINILVIDDNAADVALIRDGLKREATDISLHQAVTGAEVSSFLEQEGQFGNGLKPDLIFLELNLNSMDGREVLGALKKSDDLRIIPLIILTTSNNQNDILNAYQCNANCYIVKPASRDQFTRVVESIKNFWLTHARLLPKEKHR